MTTFDKQPVVIRPAKVEDFSKIKELVFESYYEIRKIGCREIVQSKKVQICLIALVGIIITLANFNFYQGFLLLIAFELFFWLLIRNFWKRGVLRDSPDLENIANFRETYFTSFCPSFWVAEKQTPTCKEIVGTIAVRHVIGNLKERALNHQITKSFELRRMFLKKELRGTGTAQKLLEVVKQFSKDNLKNSEGESFIVLATTEFNYSAIKFYKRKGFKIFDVVKTRILFGLVTARILLFSFPCDEERKTSSSKNYTNNTTLST